MHRIVINLLDAVHNLPRAYFQNIDTGSTSAKDELLIFANLKEVRNIRNDILIIFLLSLFIMNFEVLKNMMD
jgi:hypothetical protein